MAPPDESPSYDPTDRSMQLPVEARSETELDMAIEASILELAQASTPQLSEPEIATPFIAKNLNEDLQLLQPKQSNADENQRVRNKTDYLAKLATAAAIVEAANQTFETDEDYRKYLENQGVVFEKRASEEANVQTNQVGLSEDSLATLFGTDEKELARLKASGTDDDTLADIVDTSEMRSEEAALAIQDLHHFVHDTAIVKDPWGRFHGLRRVWRTVLKETAQGKNADRFTRLYEHNNKLRSNTMSTVPIALNQLARLSQQKELRDQFRLTEGRILARFHGTEPNTTRYSDLEIEGKVAVAQDFEAAAAEALSTLKTAVAPSGEKA